MDPWECSVVFLLFRSAPDFSYSIHDSSEDRRHLLIRFPARPLFSVRADMENDVPGVYDLGYLEGDLKFRQGPVPFSCVPQELCVVGSV